MVDIDDAENGNRVKHIKVIYDVSSECQDTNNKKFHSTISIRFVLAIEFICVQCKSQITAKVETTTQKVICPACNSCEFTVADTFNKLLESARRSTPHRTRSRRMSNKQNSNRAGRPTLDGIRREYTQLTLHPDTIDALYELGVSRGELFEFLLHLFPPFVDVQRKKTQK